VKRPFGAFFCMWSLLLLLIVSCSPQQPRVTATSPAPPGAGTSSASTGPAGGTVGALSPTRSAGFNPDEILRVSVFRSGEIQADGKVVDLTRLEELISDLTARNGVVWYYREAGKEDPPPEAMKVMALIVKFRRPVSLSSKPDFSDTVDERGISRPRLDQHIGPPAT
jgi:hypothetical protein